jgi:hypothetical protein
LDHQLAPGVECDFYKFSVEKSAVGAVVHDVREVIINILFNVVKSEVLVTDIINKSFKTKVWNCKGEIAIRAAAKTVFLSVN